MIIVSQKCYFLLKKIRLGYLKLPDEVDGSFFLSDSFDYSFLLSNSTLLPTIQIEENSLSSDCWAAKFNFDQSYLSISEVDCNAKIGVICRKVLSVPQVCELPKIRNKTDDDDEKDETIVLRDPQQTLDFVKAVEQKKRDFKEIFRKMDLKTSFRSLFSVLWYSTLPCFDVKGITSDFIWEKSLIKHCSWKGKLIPCSDIFTTFPTDQGLCCSFNMKAAEEIFSGHLYPKVLNDLQQSDANLSFYNKTLNKWYVNENEPKTQSGINKGLSFMLDAHTDLLSSSSVDRDFTGFTGLISAKGCFPLISQKGFQIRPGHNNLISLSATMIEASQDLRSLQPWRRKCIFNDETQNLTLYKEYTQSNCFLECSLQFAQGIFDESNETCTPWFFPPIKNSAFICDPWATIDFMTAMDNTPDSRCTHCLPSCSGTVYTPTVTTVPFRRCNNLNIGVSPLCKIHDKKLPNPKLWDDKDSFKRQLMTTIQGKPIFEEYDAYEDDIAMVQVFFEPSAVFLFGSQPSQTWIDYFSTVGGLLGLCIGISIVSIIELLWLAVKLAKKVFGPVVKQTKVFDLK